MMILIWTVYLLVVGMNVFALMQMNPRKLTFMDGALIGCIYYIVVPMFFILLYGSLPSDMSAPDYVPAKDISTTMVLMMGMSIVPLLRLLTADRRAARDDTDPRILWVMIGLFVISSVISFIKSGIMGGHWSSAAGDVMKQDASFVLIRHASNFSRCATFGIITYYFVNNMITRRRAIQIGLVIVLADMFMTFNRITAVYFIMMLLIMYRRNKFILIASCVVGIYSLTVVSNMWPMFRGLTSGVYGYSIDGMVTSAQVAYEQSDKDEPFTVTMNGLFESSNIVVLNYIVNHSGTDIPLLNGQMFVRPVTFFLPKFIWAGRPDNFGTTLGSVIENRGDLTLNSTSFGEPYANFGSLWFFGLMGELLIYHYLFRMIGGHSRAAGFIAAFTAFAMWRFDAVFGAISLTISFALFTALKLMNSSGSHSSLASRFRIVDRRQIGVRR